MPLQANDDDETRLLRNIRSYLAQHQTDIDRLWKRYDRWVIQPIMVTGMNAPPVESSSETSSSVESSSEVSSSVVSSSEETSSSVIESSSETSSVVESSSETSSSVTSSETSSSIESSSSSEASSSDTSSSDEYSGSCHACDICDCMHDTLYLTIDSYDSFCCGPRTPIDPIPLYWDGANSRWDSGCITPSGNACHSGSNPLATLLIRGARFRLYCEDLQLHYQPYLNFGTPPSCTEPPGLGEQIASPDTLSCDPFMAEYLITVSCGTRTPSTENIVCTVTE